MVPSRRVYLLLVAGMVVGLGIAIIGSDFTPRSLQLAIWLTLAWDGIILLLMLLDGLGAKRHRVEVARLPLDRLSIGRNNSVYLTLKAGARPAVLKIRDDYPQSCFATPEVLEVGLPAQQQAELTYSVFPKKRGEYNWGAIQVRQLGLGV